MHFQAHLECFLRLHSPALLPASTLIVLVHEICQVCFDNAYSPIFRAVFFALLDAVLWSFFAVCYKPNFCSRTLVLYAFVALMMQPAASLIHLIVDILSTTPFRSGLQGLGHLAASPTFRLPSALLY